MATTHESYHTYAKALAALTQAGAVEQCPKIVFAYGPSDFLIRKASQVLQRAWQEAGGGVYALEAGDMTTEMLAAAGGQPSLFETLPPLYVISRCQLRPQIFKVCEDYLKRRNLFLHLCFLYCTSREIADKIVK